MQMSHISCWISVWSSLWIGGVTFNRDNWCAWLVPAHKWTSIVVDAN